MTSRESKSVKVEFKASESEPWTIEGHASIFGNVDAYGDIVAKGAFARTIKHNPSGFPVFWNHNMNDLPIGWTLGISEDDVGLAFKADLGKTERGREVYNVIKMGWVRQMSFSYDVVQHEFDEDRHRLLKELRLYEISPVNFPANADTDVSAKALGTTDLLDALRALNISLQDLTGKLKAPAGPGDHPAGAEGSGDPAPVKDLSDPVYHSLIEAARDLRASIAE